MIHVLLFAEDGLLNMMKWLSKLIIALTLTTLVGCSKASKETSTYFGGKIINPKERVVVLFNNEIALDTFPLNKDNTFLGKLPSNIKEGLYYFRHGNEHQYVYLQPSDSILIRLNTWDFDESLVFSGKGALRNNLLIDCFLDKEKDERLFLSYYRLDPISFKQKTDFIEQTKLKRYNEFAQNNPKESEQFLNILKIALIYPLYGHIENYPLLHKMGKDDAIHKTFYSHRNKVDINRDSIMYFSAYRDFIVNHIYNKAYSKGHEINSDEFVIDLLKTIANDVTNPEFKNTMLRQTIVDHFYRRSTCQYNPNTFNTYFSLTSNKEDKNLVTNLLNDTKKLQAKKKFYNFQITDYNHTSRPIKSIIKGQNSFIYFWNPEYESKEYIAGRIQYLSNRFPSINFIGIRMDGNNNVEDRLKRIDIKKQYYLTKDSRANDFLTSKMPRVLIINKKGVLINGYASLSSRNTFNQLRKLSKK